MIVRQSSRDSALVRSIMGEQHPWGITEQLMAAAVDLLRVANWMNTEDGSKGRNRPEPIPRPGVEQPKRYVREAVSMDEMRDRLERKRQIAMDGTTHN